MATLPVSGDEINRRKAFRCPVPESCQEAVFVVNRREMPVQLLDESATGFAVRILQLPQVDTGDVAQIRTRAGACEVRVTYVAEEAPAEAEAASDDDLTPAFRLGLERLKDLAVAESRGPWYRRISFLRANSRGAVVVAAACMFVVAAVVAGVVVVVSLWGPKHSPPPRAATPTRRSEPPASLDWMIDRQSTASPHKEHQAPKSTATQPKSSAQPAPPSNGGSGRSPVHELPGATPFLLSSVVRDLGLDESQQSEIRQIVAATDQAVRQLGKEGQALTPQAYAQKRATLMERARQQALGILTSQQRARWDAQ